MSEKIEHILKDAGGEHAPRSGWQGRVWAELDRPARAQRHWAPWLVATVATAAALVIGISSLRVHSRTRRLEDMARTAIKQVEADAAELRKKIDEQLAQVRATDEENERLIARLRAARDAEEQRRIQDEIAANRARKQASAEELERLRQADLKRRSAPVAAKCKDTTDPLCGI